MKAIWDNRYSRIGVICIMLGLILSLIPSTIPSVWSVIVLAELALGGMVALMLVLLGATQASKRNNEIEEEAE